MSRPDQNEESLVLTPSETSRLLRISRGACYKALKANLIPNVRVGRKVLIPRYALMKWLDEGGASQLKPQELKESGLRR